jgi:hypothetical protein
MLPGAGLYLKALRALAPDRPLSIGGMGGVITGPIPFASLVAFASRYGIVGINDFDDFAHIVRALDVVETSYINEKNNKKP